MFFSSQNNCYIYWIHMPYIMIFVLVYVSDCSKILESISNKVIKYI